VNIFSTWSDLGRVLLTGVVAYVGLVILLRLSGKRTLTKLNAFDFVVTIALGSALASALLPGDAALVDGLLALVVLIVAQYLVARLQVHHRGFRRLIKSEPTLLLRRGEWRDDAMRRERVTREDVLAVLRENGLASVRDAEAVVLETDGSLSVITDEPASDEQSTLRNVRGF
jgi:uncharacterized membrane protein YcaP (DUF421 family)